jgi:OOP family OmpA-OmpF porin
VISGVVPSDADRRRLTENIAELTPNLTLASGVPDADWVDVALLGLNALGTMKYGEMTLIDHTLLLRGLVRNPDELNITLGGLERLSEAYSLITEIDLEDDGTPLRFMLVLRDGVIAGEGKFPSDITATAIEEIFGTADPIAIDQAVIAAFDPQWPVVARTAMQGLSQLIDGVLEIERRDVSLIGTGTPDAIAQVATLLATVPETFNVTVDLGLWDDGAPLEFIMEWDGSVASASGKYPAGCTLRHPAGVAITNAGTTSFRPAVTPDFSTNAAVGTSALGMMTTGSLRVR